MNLLYKTLTSGIILLSKIRWKFTHKLCGVRKDCDEANKIPEKSLLKGGFILVCCDCRLEHRVYLEDWNGDMDEFIHMPPLRPKKYDYGWRWGW